MGKKIEWTQEQVDTFIELYKQDKPFSYISEVLKINPATLTRKSSELGLSKLYPKKNCTTAHKPYHDYEWNYERYIIKGMSHEEMAEEANVKVRTIEKWCGEVHGLNRLTFRKIVRLTDKQKMLIFAGVLGDGHIDATRDRPTYIESHADDEKDYMFWKYEILKNICNRKPKYYPSKYVEFSGEYYLTQPCHRLGTRVVDELSEIHDMTRSEKIQYIDSFGYSTHFLDDGCRSVNRWQVCLAEWTHEEKQLYLQRLNDEYGICGKIDKDDRYVSFYGESVRKIDSMILKNIPNNLDIIKKKILRRTKYDVSQEVTA